MRPDLRDICVHAKTVIPGFGSPKLEMGYSGLLTESNVHISNSETSTFTAPVGL